MRKSYLRFGKLFISFEVIDSRWICGIFIHVDYPWELSVRSVERFPLRTARTAAASRFAHSRKSRVLPGESTARYKYGHCPKTLDIRFVYPP